MSRREEVERAPGKRRIEISGLGNQISGPGMSATIQDAWAEVGGQRVSEIEAGQTFDIKVRYSVSWPDKPIYILNWVFGISAIGDGIRVYDNMNLQLTNMSGIMTLDNPRSPTMPDKNVALTIQPWGSAHSTDYYKPPWE